MPRGAHAWQELPRAARRAAFRGARASFSRAWVACRLLRLLGERLALQEGLAPRFPLGWEGAGGLTGAFEPPSPPPQP